MIALKRLKSGRLKTEFDGIQLIGDQNFVDKTTAALTILQRSSRYATIIRPNLGSIHYCPIRWLRSWRNPNDAEAPFHARKKLVRVMSEELVNGDPNWYAIMLAHEAFHHFIFFEYFRFGNARGWLWHRWHRRNRDEFRCFQFQARVAEELEYEEHQVQHLKFCKIMVPNPDLPRRQLAILDHARRCLDHFTDPAELERENAESESS